MELVEALTTTAAVREFAPDPVPDAILHRVLDTARFAPSGGNRQAWRVVVIKDPDLRVQLRDLYLGGWYDYLAMRRAGLTPWAPVTDRQAEAAALEASATLRPPPGQRVDMAENLDSVPVLLALVADLRGLAAVDRDLGRYTLVGGASVYPFAWSVLLAARGEGLGGVMTTMLVREEAEVLGLLGAPAGWALCAVVALGYPAGTPPTRLRRRAVEDFTTVDRWDGPPLGPSA